MDIYTAVRQSAGVIDLSGRGRIVLRGNDRKTFLHALLTNDVAALGPGSGCYAALLTPQGRMMADLRVFELGDLLLLDVDRSVKDTLLTRFDQLIFSEDVQLGDVSDAWGCAGVFGPKSAAIAGRAIGGGADTPSDRAAAVLAALAPFQNARLESQGDVIVAARVDGFGLPGYLLFTSMERTALLGAQALAAGAVAIEPDAAEVLRVEAGDPVFPVDLTDDTIPLEAGIESRTISFTKGCYPGQEVIVRIRDRGQGRVARRLVGLTLDGEAVPARGDRLFADEKEVGHITSAVFSPALGRPIALGYVHRDLVDPGSRVQVARGDARIGATVTALPFVPAS